MAEDNSDEYYAKREAARQRAGACALGEGGALARTARWAWPQRVRCRRAQRMPFSPSRAPSGRIVVAQK